MTETAVRLLIPEECALLLVDQQAGLAFGVGSHDRQMLLNNAVALAKTARTFGLPVVAVHDQAGDAFYSPGLQ